MAARDMKREFMKGELPPESYDDRFEAIPTTTYALPGSIASSFWNVL